MPVLRLLLATVLLSMSSAGAQLKPPGADDGPRLGAPALDQRQAAKEEAAQAAAQRWLQMIDRGAYAEAWEQCAQLFRERVSKDDWVKNMPATRGPFGAAKGRKAELSVYKRSLPGVPDGEYVTVRFGTEFEKKSDAEELVTLTFEKGAWRPTGYFIR